MSLLVWIIVGLIAGWLATLVLPTPGMSLFRDMLVGMVGAILGGLLFNAIGAAGPTGFNLWSIFVAFVGAVVVLWIFRAVVART